MTRALLLLCLALLSGACRDLGRFDTGGDAAYCGSMIAVPTAIRGFLPEGAPPTLQMRLRLDTNRLTTVPATVSTDDAADGLCVPEPLFREVPMRAIEETFQDALSTLEFGEGRELNLLTWADSSCQGTMVGVISLMKNDDVEVRLLKPAPLPAADAGPAERPGFAQFVLHRRKGDCGF